jgi:SAM-dependent methyltransferase
MGEFHALLGYEAVEALDLSEGMLAVAAEKKVYTALHRMSLGEALDLPGDRYAATTAVGVLTVGHVGPAAFDELIRVTRPGGHLIFSIRTDGGNGADFIARQDALAAAGAWSPVARTAPFASLPFAEPEVENAVFVYRKATQGGSETRPYTASANP